MLTAFVNDVEGKLSAPLDIKRQPLDFYGARKVSQEHIRPTFALLSEHIQAAPFLRLRFMHFQNHQQSPVARFLVSQKDAPSDRRYGLLCTAGI